MSYATTVIDENTWVCTKYLQVLKKEHPTIVFFLHLLAFASFTPFSVVQVIQHQWSQFSTLNVGQKFSSCPLLHGGVVAFSLIFPANLHGGRELNTWNPVVVSLPASKMQKRPPFCLKFHTESCSVGEVPFHWRETMQIQLKYQKEQLLKVTRLYGKSWKKDQTKFPIKSQPIKANFNPKFVSMLEGIINPGVSTI